MGEIKGLDNSETPVASHFFETEMRWSFKPEMELLLRLAGFPPYTTYGSFDPRPLTQETDLMLVLAWKH
jgi:hypothetical protein